MNRLMIDFETLDVAECPVILSMGVVVFNENGIVDCFFEKIDQHSCLNLGCTVSVDTLLWWEEQSDAAKKAAFGGTTNIGYAMGMLVDFYKKHECSEIWSKGAIADIRWTNNILNKLNLKSPWKFWEEMCFRTYLKYSPEVDFQPVGEAHNALDDAVNQAKHWIEINQQNHANFQILNRFSPNPRHFTCQAIDTLDEVVENLLKQEDLTFEIFKKSILENEYQIELVTGNHIHGTYAIYLNPHAHIVNITKCECGKIHYLEDECIECNFDLEDNFLGNGTPIAIIQSDCNPQHELTIETHEGLILSHPLSNDEMRAIQTMAVSMTPRKKLLKNFFHSVRNQPEESFSHIQKWIESILASTNTAFFTVQIKHLNQTAKPMKALKITWLESCQLCGFSEYLNVTTEKGTDQLLNDEDEVKCPNCGNIGEIFCDDNAAAVNWHTELPF